MSKKHKVKHPKRKQLESLKYQISQLRVEPSDQKSKKPMPVSTVKQYKKHTQEFGAWCKERYKCKTVNECKKHIQDYSDYLCASGKSASTIHTYLAGVCLVMDVPLETIQKTLRVTAENTRSRGTKAGQILAVRRRHDCTILLVSPESVERNIYTLHQRTWLRMILGIHVYWFAKEKAENVRCNVFYQTN